MCGKKKITETWEPVFNFLQVGDFILPQIRYKWFMLRLLGGRFYPSCLQVKTQPDMGKVKFLALWHSWDFNWLQTMSFNCSR